MTSKNSIVLSSIIVLVALTGCFARPGTLRSDSSKESGDNMQQDWLNADIRALPISGNPIHLIEIAQDLSTFSAPYGQKVYALRLAALAHSLDRKNVKVSAALSKIAFLAADGIDGDDDSMKKNAETGVRAARSAGINTSNPEICYYFALNQGLIIRSAGLLAIAKLPEIFDALQAAQKSGHLDYGGPMRVLGMLYMKAPAWPSGIGDLEKSLELLARACELYPSHPQNFMFYAEALIQDDNNEEALKYLDIADRLAVPEIWGIHYSTRWRGEITELRRKATP